MNLRDKNILITNDDGIRAPGLRAIVEELKDLANIYVIAPEQQQSGEGKAITFGRPLRINRVKYTIEGVEAYTISGTPADATIFGLKNLAKETGPFNMTISGINSGENTSIHSMLTSGTVAAVFESALMQVPGIALSLETPHEEFFNHKHNEDFIQAAKIAKKIISNLLNTGFPDEISFFNINFPKKVKVGTPIVEADIARYKYSNYAIKRADPRGIPYYWVWGDMLSEFGENTDTNVVLKKKQISISAINLHDWTSTKKHNLDSLFKDL